MENRGPLNSDRNLFLLLPNLSRKKFPSIVLGAKKLIKYS